MDPKAAARTILLLILPVQFAAAQISVPNNSFELGEGRQTLEHWELGWYSSSQGAIGPSNSAVHEGGFSLHCAIDDPEQFAHWTHTAISVPEGSSALELSLWCRAERVSDTFATIGIIFENAEGYWFDQRLWMVVVTHDMDWTELSGQVTIPSDAHTMRVVGWVNYQMRGTGAFWFDDISLRAVESAGLPATEFRDVADPPLASAEDLSRGFIPYTRDYTRVLFADAKPRSHERAEVLSLTATPGEREPVVLGIYATRDLASVKVRATDLQSTDGATIGSDAIEIRNVRYHPRDGEPRSGPFNETPIENAPLVLEQRETVSVNSGQSQPFWITVSVPEDVPSGRFTGSVSIETESGPATTLPLQLDVLPFTLDDPEEAMFAMYTRMRTDPERLRETFADMRAHGMTGVALTGASGLPFRMEGDAPIVEFAGDSPLELNMKAYVDAGFTQPMLWLMGGDVAAFSAKQGPSESEAFANCYRSIVQQIKAHGEASGWPEIIYQPIDEPYDHLERLPETIRRLEILKSIPGLRTEEDGMNAAWDRMTDHAYKLTDVFVLHDGPVLERGKLHPKRWEAFVKRANADDKEIWFYNVDLSTWRPEPMRFMSGFGLWQSGATGLVSWSYMTGVNEAKPELVYGRGNNYFFRYPQTADESGGPTVGYEGLREGTDDYRYLVTLHNRVLQARASGNSARMEAADQIWQQVEGHLSSIRFTASTGRAAQGRWTGPLRVEPDGTRVVSGDHKLRNGWDFADYTWARKSISDGIARLDELAKGEATANAQ